MSTTLSELRSEVQHLTRNIAAARAYRLNPVRMEAKLQRLKAELAVLEAEARAQDIRGAYARGYEHGLLGMGADVEEGDLEWLWEAGHDEEAEEAAAYLHGFEQGDLVAQVEPVARVEALERLGRAWDQQPDSHPGKEAALDEIGEHLQIARAGLREEFPALLAG